MTILEVFETSYYPSTNLVVGKVACQVAKRRYKTETWHTIQYCSRNNTRTPMKSDLLVSPSYSTFCSLARVAAGRTEIAFPFASTSKTKRSKLAPP